MGFSTPPGHKNPTYDNNTNGLIDQAEGVNVPAYEEDPNSPFTSSQQTQVTFTLANSSQQLLILTGTGQIGHGQLRVNGDSGADYQTAKNDGTLVTGLDAFQISAGRNLGSLRLKGVDGLVSMSQTAVDERTDAPVGGSKFSFSPPFDQFTLLNEAGAARDTRLRVFTLDI